MSTAPVLPMFNSNNQEIILGPIVDGVKYHQNPQIIQLVTDLTITASLYRGRSLTDPDGTPGTKVTAFGTAGDLSIPYSGQNGIYQNLSSYTFKTTPGLYVIVFDAPLSPSGYQLHIERELPLSTREN